ncbi:MULTISPECIES: minor capsid protein [Megasphaera]|nr:MULTISPECIES: minor capsid protein [Megasphaera]
MTKNRQKKTADYWNERYERLKLEQMGKAEAVNKDLKRVYAASLRKLQADINDWYNRYATENGLSLADAKRQLTKRELKAFRLTLDEYKQLAKQKDLPNEFKKMLENASIRVRLDRAEQLYIQVVQSVAEMAKQQELDVSKLLKTVYEDSTYKTAYEVQNMQSKYKDVSVLNQEEITQAVNKPWAQDGKDFSTRIWKNGASLINTLQTEITQSLMVNEGTLLLAARVAHRYDVSFNEARRLVETETAYIQEKASFEVYDRLGVEQYQILATLDNKTSSICRHLDGKIFDVKDAKIGVTTPPFHCYCRTTTIPYIEGITDDWERAARDKNGKTEYVSSDLTYQEWYNKYVKNNDTNSLIGIKTSNGIRITSISKHQQDRADTRGLSVFDIQDALVNSLHIDDIRVDERGKSQRFIGEKVTVNVNPDNGNIITSWGTGKRVVRKYKKEKDNE